MDRIYLNDLYDLYQSLLTKHEQEVFTNYYQDDLTLSEISINNSVSRSATSKTLKAIINKLNNYETNLHLYHKKQDIINCLKSKNYDKIEDILG
jgi:uncharacterized protein